jgi:hypothetical protein
MTRRIVLLMALLVPLATSAQSLDSLRSLKDPFTALLRSQLGVTEDQAAGGIGSILTLAQEKLIKGDFDKIAQVIPGASNYMAQAKSLGAVTGPIKDMKGLQDALGRLAMSPEMRAKFVPAVTNYVGKAGGESVQKLLAGVLK